MIAQNTDPAYKMASQAQTTWLMDLPDEILITVMSYLGFDTLMKAKLVCKHFDVLADQFVYQDPKILKGRQAVQLAAAFNKNNLRRTWVKSLLVSTKFGEDSGLTRLPVHLREMRNLESLRLETPDCNSRQPNERLDWIHLQDMYESVFEQSSLLVTDARLRRLPYLRECTLHFVDLNVELYSLTRYASIFLHPRLRSLTLSCASTDIPEQLHKALHYPKDLERTTDLESLFLEECDIHAPTLAYLLKFPRALKSFKFSEGVRYDGLFRSGSRRLHGNIRPNHLMNALTASCADSLESLSLSLGYRYHSSQTIADPGQSLNMTKMTRLKFIEVDYATLQLIKPRSHCDHKTWLRLPRSLETLKVCSIHLNAHLPFEARREPQIPINACMVTEKDKHGVPNLKTIIYSYDFTDDEDDYTEFDDFLLLGNAHLPMPALLDMNHVPQALPTGPPAHGPINANPAGVNLGNAGIGPLNGPVHPPQPPVAGIPAHLTNNLNLVNPGNHNQAQQFLRQNWFTHVNRGRNPAARMQREFSQLEMCKIALLRILNNTLLSQFRQQGVRLTVDMVKLPRGFIPPYLYPEDKPTTYASWWDSNEAKETEAYKREFRLAREAKIFERNLREERERRRREEEFRQRIASGEIRLPRLPFLAPGEQEQWQQVMGANAGQEAYEDDNDVDDGDDDDDDDDDEYIDIEDDNDDEDDEEEDLEGYMDEVDEHLHDMPLFVSEEGITIGDDDDDDNAELETDTEDNNYAVASGSGSGAHGDTVPFPSFTTSIHTETGGGSEDDHDEYLDAPGEWPNM